MDASLSNEPIGGELDAEMRSQAPVAKEGVDDRSTASASWRAGALGIAKGAIAACCLAVSAGSGAWLASVPDIELDYSIKRNLMAVKEALLSKASDRRAMVERARALRRRASDGPLAVFSTNGLAAEFKAAVKVAGPHWLNGSMRVENAGSAMVSELTIVSDSKGHYAFADGFLGKMSKGDPNEAAMEMVLIHEWGHEAYASLVASGSLPGWNGVLSESGVDGDGAAKAVEEFVNSSLWAQKVLNESFADAMALAFQAKKLSEGDFESFAAGLMLQRLSAESEAMRQGPAKKPFLGKGGVAEFKKIPFDTHLTRHALLSAAAIGQEPWARGSPEDIASMAYRCAQEGLAQLVAKNPRRLLEVYGSSNAKALTDLGKAGARLRGLNAQRLGKGADFEADFELALVESSKKGLPWTPPTAPAIHGAAPVPSAFAARFR